MRMNLYIFEDFDRRKWRVKSSSEESALKHAIGVGFRGIRFPLIVAEHRIPSIEPNFEHLHEGVIHSPLWNDLMDALRTPK